MTPNFLGGVSRQTDDKKLDGQVVDIINGYPDPTYNRFPVDIEETIQ